jgi:hypothetical protein
MRKLFRETAITRYAKCLGGRAAAPCGRQFAHGERHANQQSQLCQLAQNTKVVSTSASYTFTMPSANTWNSTASKAGRCTGCLRSELVFEQACKMGLMVSSGLMGYDAAFAAATCVICPGRPSLRAPRPSLPGLARDLPPSALG